MNEETKVTINEVYERLGREMAIAQIQILQLEKEVDKLKAENEALKKCQVISSLSPEAARIAESGSKIIRDTEGA